MGRETKQNWFETLSEALDSEGLIDHWGNNYIGYGETGRVMAEIEGRYRCITIYRSDTGRYERPVHYDSGAINNHINQRAGR